jgi:general stress protein 26
MLNNWFEGGKQDANLALLNVNMEQAYYWDSKLHKLVSFFELIEGDTADLGQKGYVNLQSY